MKKTKIAMLSLAVIIAVGMSACGKRETSNETNNNYESYGNFEKPSQDDINYSIEEAKADTRIEKYSHSEYEKITLNAFVPREGVKDYPVQDLYGNEVDWLDEEVDTKVEFYIPTELVGDITYDENNTTAFVTINASTSNQGNYSTNVDSNSIETYPLQLEIRIARDGYWQNGLKTNTLENDEEFYNSIANNRFSNKKIVESLVNSGTRGTTKMIYEYEDEYKQPTMIAIKDTALSPKMTACLELKAYNDSSIPDDAFGEKTSEGFGQRNAYSITDINHEILYEVLDSIQVELVEQSE